MVAGTIEIVAALIRDEAGLHKKLPNSAAISD
jgi:hypothetical protein